MSVRNITSIPPRLFLEVVFADVDLVSDWMAVVRSADLAAKCPAAVATVAVAMPTAAAAEFVVGVDGRPSATD